MNNKELQAETEVQQSKNAELLPSAPLVANPVLPAVLRLTLKKKWYDMILSGEKKEEYREVKAYWTNRLVDVWIGEGEEYHHEDTFRAKEFDYVEFKNGYAKDAPTMLVEFKGIEIGNATPEWSDNWQGQVFAISLGAVLHSS